jgi:Molecular chaperone GrpE (heat shock protein)
MNKKDDKKVPEKKNIEQTSPDTSAREEATASQEEAEVPKQVSTPKQEASEEENSPSKQTEKSREKSEAEVLKGQLADANDKYLRLAAEYDNYRRRSQIERENIYSDIRADTVTRFLPVYDNLARAVTHESNAEDKKGAEAILNQFKTILSFVGVTEIEAVGKKFDPKLHNAVLHIEDKKYGEGEIVLELEKGFKMGDKVIRFSTVQVAN